MTNTRQLIIGLFMAAISVAPMAANASEPRTAACSVSVTYLLNNVVRSTYVKDFVVSPGAPFSDDFSTVTRFRFFDASATLAADGKSTTVSINYYNDIGVFESVDFDTALTLHDDKSPESTAGRHSYWSSLGVAGEHTTRYELTCQLLKD